MPHRNDRSSESRPTLAVVVPTERIPLAEVGRQLVDLQRILGGLIDDLDDFAASLAATAARINGADHPAGASVSTRDWDPSEL